jgi:translation initiation factor eIF-2B subunit gamma
MHDYVKNLTFSPTASPYLDNMALSGPPSATDSEDDDTASASLRISVVLHRARDGYVARANNLQSYLALNWHVRSRSKIQVHTHTLIATNVVPCRHHLFAPN